MHPIVLRGAVTGRTYVCDAAAGGIAVDARDAPALLASGFFAGDR
jgi:hypothetical protein